MSASEMLIPIYEFLNEIAPNIHTDREEYTDVVVAMAANLGVLAGRVLIETPDEYPEMLKTITDEIERTAREFAGTVNGIKKGREH